MRENARVAHEKLINEITTRSRNIERLNTTLVIAFASIERKVPTRKDTKRSATKGYFEFSAFSNGENLLYTNWAI